MKNFSIYLRQLDDGNYYLFGYYEYDGSDYDGDMRKLSAEKRNVEWLSVTDLMQKPLRGRSLGPKWKRSITTNRHHGARRIAPSDGTSSWAKQAGRYRLAASLVLHFINTPTYYFGSTAAVLLRSGRSNLLRSSLRSWRVNFHSNGCAVDSQ